MSEIVLLYTTWPDAASAEAFARGVVGAGLAACANISAPMTSVYRWNDAIESAPEVAAIFKTAAHVVPDFRRRLLAEHPHETPCLLATSVERSLSDPAYMDWLESAIFRAETQA